MQNTKKLMAFLILATGFLFGSQKPFLSLEDLKKKADIEYANYKKEFENFNISSKQMRDQKQTLIRSKKPNAPEANLSIDKQIKVIDGKLHHLERQLVHTQTKSLTATNEYLSALNRHLNNLLLECNNNREIEKKALEDCQSELAEITTEEIFPQNPDQIIHRPALTPIDLNRIKTDK